MMPALSQPRKQPPWFSFIVSIGNTAHIVEIDVMSSSCDDASKQLGTSPSPKTNEHDKIGKNNFSPPILSMGWPLLEPLKFNIQDGVVYFGGSILPDTDFSALLKIPPPVTFDMTALGAINSIGTGAWVNFLKKMPHPDYVFRGCNQHFVGMVTLVPSALGPGSRETRANRIKSITVEYSCGSCNDLIPMVVPIDMLRVGKGGVNFPKVRCKKCEHPAEIDEFMDEAYCHFLESLKGA